MYLGISQIWQEFDSSCEVNKKYCPATQFVHEAIFDFKMLYWAIGLPEKSG